MKLLLLTSSLLLAEQASGFAFVANKNHRQLASSSPSRFPDHTATSKRQSSTGSSLSMVDDQILLGAGVAVAGLVAGIGLVAFTEAQGERAKERGGGLSDRMATSIAGGLLEDMEVSSVDDLGSLTSQLEQALKESASAKGEDLEMTEEAKKRLTEEADDGW
ncbi:hypothetical protein MPSEU_000790700 [Mayamaea pseudoterrestris]|nr:hypothetical protein MPSEU_000790700 [Mayamaea pseudoterrestris]